MDWESGIGNRSSFVDDDATARDAIVDARSIEYIFILFIDRSDHDDDDDDDRDDDDDDDIGIVEIATRRRRARATRAEAEYWTTRRARDGHAQGTTKR